MKRKPLKPTPKRRVHWRNAKEREAWKQLAKRAARKARRLGHRVSGWHITGRHTMGARCELCGWRMAGIALFPEPVMGGPALRERCTAVVLAVAPVT